MAQGSLKLKKNNKPKGGKEKKGVVKKGGKNKLRD